MGILNVAFVWHMHQPFYKDTLSGAYKMPWVRLHGIKDYYPMAALLENFPNVKATFNLVPSLVEQLNDYVKNDATDMLLDLTVKKADSLTLDERAEVIRNFFKVNFKNFIAPSPRYTELLLKKGIGTPTLAASKKIIESFAVQELIDLQVHFNLSWFHSITTDKDARLKALITQDHSYTEDDKQYIVMKQKEVLAAIIPLYRKLQAQNRIDITATPYYHPILPLLCDTSVAKVSLPDNPLPKRRFAHPEDARWHIDKALRYHTEQFGRPPKGMWPSEGSVSSEALEIAMSLGVQWVATDEDILFESLKLMPNDGLGGKEFDRNMIYEPYAFERNGRSITMIFRDKNLSDIISFNYHSWEQDEAALDLMGHFKRIAAHLGPESQKALVTIVMDGENAWEYFPDNGRKFFETLYAALDKKDVAQTVTISGFLKDVPPKKVLKEVYPASWINHNFDIWIGQEQDNESWEYLTRVREDLVKFTKDLGKNAKQPMFNDLEDAWREFYIAEGSDWNWWYSGKLRAGDNNPFDELYRVHLSNVYRILKKPVPEFLNISIA